MEEELGQGTTTVPERLACLAGQPKIAQSIEPDEGYFLAWLTIELA